MWYDFWENKEHYKTEWLMLSYMGITTLILLTLLAISYLSFWRSDPTFLAKRGWWLVYLIITIVSTGGALWHFASHKTTFSTMTGMMIGMAIGMQSGVMLSVVIGSTNGMFMGSFLGVIFGSSLGIYAGRCCGLMGILQGAMAGIMGGTMGPMIALMMKNDHILYFMPLFAILNVLVLLGLSFLVYEDVTSRKEKVERKPTDFATFFSYCLIITTLFTVIIVYGYKSAFVA